jgi:rod shape-determining protein MreD
MKRFLWIFCGICLGIVQVSVLDYFVVFNVKPDIVLVFAVVATLVLEEKQALPIAIFSGVVRDAFGGGVFGTNTLLFALWSISIIRLSKKFTLEYAVVRSVLLCVVVFLHHLFLGLQVVFLGGFIALGVFLRTLFLEVILSAAVAPLAFALVIFLNSFSFSSRLLNVQSKDY